MNDAVPILLYHRIDRSLLSTATSPPVFRQHLAWLAERGWRTLTSEEFEFFMRSGKPLPPRRFLITFDDGYESIASAAFDILKEFRYQAIAFVSTGLLHQDSGTAGSVGGETAYLSWAQVRQLQASGVIDFQSHTHSHQLFRHWPLARICDDLAASVDILSHEMALPKSRFNHLAWPWGRSTREWRAAASRAGFRYQYTVARRSYRMHMPHDEIPRTCFDAVSFTRFQWQYWLQCGQIAPLWHAAYPFGRRLRQFAGLRL